MDAANKLLGRDSSGSVCHQASSGMPGPGCPCARDSLETHPLFTGGQLHREESRNVISELQRRGSGSPYRSGRGLYFPSSEPSASFKLSFHFRLVHGRCATPSACKCGCWMPNYLTDINRRCLCSLTYIHDEYKIRRPPLEINPLSIAYILFTLRKIFHFSSAHT